MQHKYITKKRPDICPLCKGKGKYEDKDKQCHGCEGKGWVVIDESYWVQEYPYQEYPYQDYPYITYPWIPTRTLGTS